MKYNELKNRYSAQINNAIRLIYSKRINSVNDEFLQDYYSELSKFFLSTKNRFYSLLSIATFKAFSEIEDERIILPSIGIEFLHNSRLIHDDLIFKNNLHDTRPSFNYRFQQYHSKYKFQKMIAEDFGNNIGLLGGDTSIYVGLEAFLDNNFDIKLNLKAIEYYEEVSHQTYEGVLIEIDMMNKENLTISDYIEMIALKIGAMVEKSLLIGVNYTNCEDKHKNLISTFGINLGILLQIIEDTSGIWGEKKMIENLVNGHIRKSRISPLLIEANNKLDVNDRLKLNTIIKTIDFGKDLNQDVGVLFQKAGILESIKNLIDFYYNKVKDAFIKLKPLMNREGLDFFEDLIKTFTISSFPEVN